MRFAVLILLMMPMDRERVEATRFGGVPVVDMITMMCGKMVVDGQGESEKVGM